MGINTEREHEDLKGEIINREAFVECGFDVSEKFDEIFSQNNSYFETYFELLSLKKIKNGKKNN